MSSVKVEVVKVDSIETHPNADRLDIACIKGWRCVVGKGSFAAGDLAIYFPIDSVLPAALEAQLFKDSKIKLSNHRIRTVKIRGVISQGLLIAREAQREGSDLTEELGVTKYEPPISRSPRSNAEAVKRRETNPSFHKYTDIENYKNHPGLFAPGELVYVLEKIHGSNFRAGWVRKHPKNWFHAVFLSWGFVNTHEFLYGSHNVQLSQNGKLNIYWEMVTKYKLRESIPKDTIVYGEVYGDGVQKGYTYDCMPGERKLVIFDVQQNGWYFNHDRVRAFCGVIDLPVVPGDYNSLPVAFNPERILSNVDSISHLGWKPREGVVIKPVKETLCYLGRKILKWKSDEFLLKAEDNTH